MRRNRRSPAPSAGPAPVGEYDAGGRWFYALMLAAIAVGIWFRFVGIDLWPLSWDEYYVAKSVEAIVAHGVPAFECGGYYTRGLIYQYLNSALFTLGLRPETALRWSAALFNLAALPAVFLLGRRLGGVAVAALATSLFSLSLWEIEFARFGRMYAPFQAVFLWYLLALMRVTVDGDRRAWPWVYGLTIAGVLLWEGGIFLALLNFVPLLIRREKSLLLPTLGSALVFVVTMVFLSYDFRTFHATAHLPGDVGPMEHDMGISGGPYILWPTLLDDGVWLIASLVPLLTSLFAVFAIARTDAPVLARVSLALVILFAMLNLFGMVLAALLVLSLMAWIDVRILPRRVFSIVLFTVGLNFVFWLIYGWFSQAWHVLLPAFDQADSLRKLLVVLFKFPNIFDRVIFRWMEAIPFLGLLLASSIFIVLLDCLRGSHSQAGLNRRLALLILILLVLVVGLVPTTYIATRYTFFIYPLALALAVTGLWFLANGLLGASAVRKPVFAVLCLAAFLATEDLDLRHLLHIDSEEFNYRLSYSNAVADHYYIREDFRSPADYINEHAGPDDTIVLVAGLPIDYYVRRVDYVFRDYRDLEFAAVACAAGTRERWSNARLLYREAALFELLQQRSGVVWLVAFNKQPDRASARIRREYDAQLVHTSVDGLFNVYKLEPPAVATPR